MQGLALDNQPALYSQQQQQQQPIPAQQQQQPSPAIKTESGASATSGGASAASSAAASAAGPSSGVGSSSGAPKKLTWASIASQPAKPQLAAKKKSMVPPPMVTPRTPSLDIGTWENKNGSTAMAPPSGATQVHPTATAGNPSQIFTDHLPFLAHNR